MFRGSSKSERAAARRGATDLDALRTAVVKITAHSRPFDWQQPYNRNLAGRSGTGTGFVLEEVQRGDSEVCIVTAYHVVDFGERLLVELSDVHHEGGPIEATLVLYSASLDVAVITIPIPTPEWMRPLRTAQSDALRPNTQVQAAGFPLRKGFQMTFGNISGRGATRVQVDAAINPGNSGGPLVLVDENTVVGVVVSGYDAADAQNMNYATPIEEVRRSLFPQMPPPGAPVPFSAPQLSLNLDIVRINPELKATMKGCSEGGGAYVAFVIPGSALHECGVRKGDLLCAVGGHSVDIRGNVRCEWWPFEALPPDSVLQRMKEGDPLTVQFWSQTEGGRTATVAAERDRSTFRAYDPESEEIDYALEGGVVVQMMSENLMEASKRLQLGYGFVFRQPRLRAHSLLTVSYILPSSPFTTMGVLHEGVVIVQVNDTRVGTLAEYREAFARARREAPVVILHTYFGDIACATPQSIAALDEEVARLTA